MDAVQLAILVLDWMWENPETEAGQPKTLDYLKNLIEEHMPGFFEITEVSETGFWCDWGPNPKVLSIADVDALKVDGAKGHFCGHNGNTAKNIGCMKMLYDMTPEEREKIEHGFRFAFETDEDGGHLQTPGIHALIENKLLDDVAWALKTHFVCPMPGVPLTPGRFMVVDGPATAYAAVLDIVIKGVGGHPAMIGPNSVLPIRDTLNTFLNKKKGKYHINVTMGLHEGADRVNVEPARIHQQGAVLCFDKEAARLLFEKFKKFVEEIKADWLKECTPNAQEVSDIKTSLRELYMPSINNPSLAENARESLRQNNPECLTLSLPVPAGETFGNISEKVPAIYIYCGTENTSMPHQPTFKVTPDDLEATIPLIWDRQSNCV